MGSGIVCARGQHLPGHAAPISALDALMAKIPVRVSANMCQPWRATKQNNVIRLGSRIDYIQPLWMGVTILVDEMIRQREGRDRSNRRHVDEHEDSPEPQDSTSNRSQVSLGVL